MDDSPGIFDEDEGDDEMLDNFGESKVTVKKGALLSAISGNRAKHVEEFMESEKSYRAAVVEKLTAMLADAKEGKDVEHSLNLPRPMSHEKDYTRVIKMLEMSTADEIVITEQQFSQYVQDEWQWMGQFKAISASYNSSPGARR